MHKVLKFFISTSNYKKLFFSLLKIILLNIYNLTTNIFLKNGTKNLIIEKFKVVIFFKNHC